MLHDLLKIKVIREKSAHDDVRKCNRLVEESLQKQQQREKELDDYIKWRRQEEEDLYEEILNTEVKQHDLDFLKQKVAVMREKDSELEQAVESAKSHVLEAKQKLEEAKITHQRAMQAVEKFQEFTAVLDEEAAKEAERLEDLEMEEFTVRRNN